LSLKLNEMAVLGLILQRGASTLSRAQRSYQKMTVDESACASLFLAIDQAEQSREPRHPGRIVHLKEAITLDDVSIRVGERTILENVSARIPVRGITLIDGRSGAGKTTLLDLLAGLRHPESGRLLVDGTPFEELDLTAWRRQIGYVAQESTLFHGTVFSNVTLEDEAILDADVERALRSTFAWEFVSKLPDGIHTVVGERGGTLSGGERQRIALARALVHQPQLLLLDECTTALDPETEEAVLETIRSLRGRFTVVAVSHQEGVRSLADHVLKLALVKDSGSSATSTIA
jgi:ATP-binding cassette subfamily C protein